jgi:hypothetical protein
VRQCASGAATRGQRHGSQAEHYQRFPHVPVDPLVPPRPGRSGALTG